MTSSYRRWLRLAGAATILAIAVAGWRAAQVVAIGVAYAAKMTCSGIYLAKRDPQAVLADLAIDDLSMLRYLRVSADDEHFTVTASAAGLVRRRAVYREGLGCAVVLGDRTPPSFPAGDAGASGSRGSDSAWTPFPVPPPGENVSQPELAAVIHAAFSEPDSVRPRRTRAVVVVDHGRIVGEQYAEGVDADTPLPGWSMAKSVTNALVGVLVGEGRLTLDAPAPIPEWHEAGDPRRAITLDQLLRMSSGLRFEEGMSNPRSNLMRMLFEAGDGARLAIDQELVAPPGTVWEYSSGTSNIIARAIRNAIGNDAEYLGFPRRAFFDRVGMTSAVLETDAAGTFVGSSFMYATAQDWARFGMLYLYDGMWGAERVLPEEWVAYSRTPAPADSTKHYGAHFWLAVPDEYCSSGSLLPADAFHAAGHEGQFVTIIPSRELVIVRLGRTRYAEAWDHCAFVRDVIGALDRKPTSTLGTGSS